MDDPTYDMESDMKGVYIPEDTVFANIDPMKFLRWCYVEMGLDAFKHLLAEAYADKLTKREIIEEIAGGDITALYKFDEELLEQVNFEIIQKYVTDNTDSEDLFYLAANNTPEDDFLCHIRKFLMNNERVEIADMIHHGDMDLKKLCDEIGWDEILRIAEREGKLRNKTKVPTVGYVANRKIEFEREEESYV